MVLTFDILFLEIVHIATPRPINVPIDVGPTAERRQLIMDELNTDGKPIQSDKLRHVSRTSLKKVDEDTADHVGNKYSSSCSEDGSSSSSEDFSSSFGLNAHGMGGGYCGDVAIAYHDMYPATENTYTRL